MRGSTVWIWLGLGAALPVAGCGPLFCIDLDRCRSPQIIGDTGSIPGDTGDTGDTGTTGDTGDSGGPHVFEPYAFFVGGGFAWDPATGTGRGYNVSGAERQAYFSVTIVEQEYFDAADYRYACEIRFLLNEPFAMSPLTFVESYRDSFGGSASITLTHWQGTMPLDTADVQTTCIDSTTGEPKWNASVWGDDPARLVSQWTWGLGFGNIRPDIEDWLAEVVPDPELASRYIGGGLGWSRFSEAGDQPYMGGNYAMGYLVEGDFEEKLTADGRPVPFTPETLLPFGDDPPPAVIEIGPYMGFYADYLLP